MAKHRVYIDPKWIEAHQENALFALPKEAAHRLQTVLRLESGTLVEAFDGTGKIVTGALAFSPHVGLVDWKLEENNSSQSQLYVLQAVIKMAKLEQVIQRGVELGATRFILFEAERSQVDFGEKSAAKLDRLKRIAEDATRQSLRSHVPQIEGVYSLKALCALLEAEGMVKVMGVPTAQSLLSQTLFAHSAFLTHGMSVLIGPEGGLSEQEENYLTEQGFMPVRIGEYVMRTETAAMAALTVAQVCLGYA